MFAHLASVQKIREEILKGLFCSSEDIYKRNNFILKFQNTEKKVAKLGIGNRLLK